ncbi:MAG: S26 family signal peptidase [Isosphaeraceae bacterium]|nr:S26 family signal peptidase [Isosphaeraceae bacterium]
MTKSAGRRDPRIIPAPPNAVPEAPAPPAAKKEPQKESLRDIVEQIVVAVILAVVIRGFVVEPFVIPTGSMAPTLMGRHLELTCEQCGHVYPVGADERTEGYVLAHPGEDKAICGNCRYLTRTPQEPRFKGDRILVMKFPYEFPFLPGASDPERWDVIVFHYPEEPETNYIKRMVGMPGEELKIVTGDLHARAADSLEPFRILRKPLEHQLAMQMPVYDDRRRPKALADDPQWRRWRAPAGGWSEPSPGRFYSESSSSEWSSLRYHNLVPDPEQWDAVLRSRPLPSLPRRSLITDFYSYNGSTTGDPRNPNAAWLQSNWVGDLTIECRVESESAEGIVRLELVEAGVSNRCDIDLATGVAVLYHGDRELGKAETSLRGKTTADLRFANVDDRLTLWVSGSTPFGEGLTYDDGPIAADFGPKIEDLDPVSISVKGGRVAVSDLVLHRDIYYTQEAGVPDASLPSGFGGGDSEWAPVMRMFELLRDPQRFSRAMAGIPSRSFVIRPGNYMMMGDNSPRSSDSRMWGARDTRWTDGERSGWEVPRELMVGKAFYVYWPHCVPFWPNLSIGRDIRIPFRPYFERMRPIR